MRCYSQQSQSIHFWGGRITYPLRCYFAHTKKERGRTRKQTVPSPVSSEQNFCLAMEACWWHRLILIEVDGESYRDLVLMSGLLPPRMLLCDYIGKLASQLCLPTMIPLADTVLQLPTQVECRAWPNPVFLVANLVRQWNMRSCATHRSFCSEPRERKNMISASLNLGRQKQHNSSWTCSVSRFTQYCPQTHFWKAISCQIQSVLSRDLDPCKILFPTPQPLAR